MKPHLGAKWGSYFFTEPNQGESMFSPIEEKNISRALIGEYYDQFLEATDSDILIIGSGPSGLVAGRLLAEAGC